MSELAFEKGLEIFNNNEINQTKKKSKGRGYYDTVDQETNAASSDGKDELEKPAVYVSTDLKGWLNKEASNYKGLVVPRPFRGKYNQFIGCVDEALDRLSNKYELAATINVPDDESQLSKQLINAIDDLLTKAQLPESLCEQVRSDTSHLGCTVASLCPSSKSLAVKLEIFGENTCSRWHVDHYIGRGIVTYTGNIGTEFTRDSNVDFWELKHCGKNEHVIKDKKLVKNVAVGDILFMKGAKFTPGVDGLVHKSPEKQYHENGKIFNRLMLKIDALSPDAAIF